MREVPKVECPESIPVHPVFFPISMLALQSEYTRLV